MTRARLIVVTYNSAAHVPRICEVHRSLPSSCEFTVVDNASSDYTADRLCAAGVPTIRLARNVGYGAACNVGAQSPGVDVYVFANPDVVISVPGLLEMIGCVASDGRGPAFVGPVFGTPPVRVKRFATLGREVYGLGPGWARPILRAVSRGRWQDDCTVCAAAGLVPVDFPLGALLVCDARVFNELGGFDEQYFLYSEEEDLCLRARYAGWTSAILPAVIARHRGASSSAGESPISLALTRLQSRVLFYRIHRGRAYALVARVVIALLIALHQVVAGIRRRPSAYRWDTAVSVLVGRRNSLCHRA